jgi:hypothetical protein
MASADPVRGCTSRARARTLGPHHRLGHGQRREKRESRIEGGGAGRGTSAATAGAMAGAWGGARRRGGSARARSEGVGREKGTGASEGRDARRRGWGCGAERAGLGWESGMRPLVVLFWACYKQPIQSVVFISAREVDPVSQSVSQSVTCAPHLALLSKCGLRPTPSPSPSRGHASVGVADSARTASRLGLHQPLIPIVSGSSRIRSPSKKTISTCNPIPPLPLVF